MKSGVVINIAAQPTSQAEFKLAIEMQAQSLAPTTRVCGIYLSGTQNNKDLPLTLSYLYSASALTGQVIVLG